MIDEKDIRHILITHLQNMGKLKNNIPIHNMNLRQENGEIKFTVKE